MQPENELIRACSWCEKVEGTDGQWNSIMPEMRQGYESEMRMTHGICPPCYFEYIAAFTSPI